MEERYTHENGEPSAMKVASSVRRGVHASADRNVGWSEPTLLLAALLWSFALSEINRPDYDVDFLTAILLNILLAFSVIVTPLIVGKLLRGGLHTGAAALGGAILGAAAMTPAGMTGLAAAKITRGIASVKPREET